MLLNFLHWHNLTETTFLINDLYYNIVNNNNKINIKINQVMMWFPCRYLHNLQLNFRTSISEKLAYIN